MSVTMLSHCYFAPFMPRSRFSSHPHWRQLTLCRTPVWGKKSCSFGRKLQPQARMVHTRKPCPGYSVGMYLSNLALRCPFPVLPQCLNGPGSLKYLSAATHHILLPIGSTVNGTLQKQAAPLGHQEVRGLVQGSGKLGPSSVHLCQDQSQRAALAAGRSRF